MVVTSGDPVNGVPARLWVVDFDGDGFSIAQTLDVPDDPQDIVVEDLDGDGPCDVVLSFLDGTLRVFTADGAGGLEAASELSVGDAASDLEVADLDADGHLDLIAVASDEVAVLAGQGDGTFVAGPGVSATPFEIRLADADGDGAPDLIANRVVGAFPNTTNELDAYRGFCDGASGRP